MVAEFEKARVRDFMRDHERPRRSPLSEKLEICPTLACIAGNIPGRKLSKWTLSDEHYQARFKEIRLCLHGLIGHGAHLAACGSEEQIPALRDFICLSAPVIKCKKTPRKKCSFVAEMKGKR